MAERSASMTACSILLIAARRRPASRATAAGCGRPARRRQQGKQVIPKPTQPNVDISQVPQIQQTQVRPDMQPGQGGNMNLAPPFRSAPAEASKLTAFRGRSRSGGGRPVLTAKATDYRTCTGRVSSGSGSAGLDLRKAACGVPASRAHVCAVQGRRPAPFVCR
jgi:hypothetical protein